MIHEPHLFRLRGSRQALPTKPSPLEQGDDWFERGQLAEALAHYQQQALKEWPSIWPGWSTAQLSLSRRADLYFLKLIESRRKESRAGTSRGGAFSRTATPLDPLFPDVRFVGPSGKYGHVVVAHGTLYVGTDRIAAFVAQ